MILRRLAGYLRHDNWFTVILELVIVVVGLFLAFQLDRWYESQRSKSDLQAHLVSLTERYARGGILRCCGRISILTSYLRR